MIQTQHPKAQGEVTCTGLYVGAALLTAGCKLVRIQPVEGTDRVAFVFDDSRGEAAQTLRRYWDRRLTVDAKDYADSIYHLKRQAHSATIHNFIRGVSGDSDSNTGNP